jgi:asparaginyl-tRNA synthetase
VELKATKIHHVGKTDASVYPLAKKKQSYEFLREKMHLRPRYELELICMRSD